MRKRMTFALAFCNRGFMPGKLIYGAREDMIKAVTDAGYDYIAMDKQSGLYFKNKSNLFLWQVQSGALCLFLQVR